MSFCIKCGKDIGNANFCTACGTPAYRSNENIPGLSYFSDEELNSIMGSGKTLREEIYQAYKKAIADSTPDPIGTIYDGDIDKQLNTLVTALNHEKFGDRFPINDAEKKILREFIKLSLECNTNCVIDRMGDGTFNIRYNGIQVGRIKLRSNRTRMQIIIGTYGVYQIDNLPVEDLMKLINYWFISIINLKVQKALEPFWCMGEMGAPAGHVTL